MFIHLGYLNNVISLKFHHCLLVLCLFPKAKNAVFLLLALNLNNERQASLIAAGAHTQFGEDVRPRSHQPPPPKAQRPQTPQERPTQTLPLLAMARVTARGAPLPQRTPTPRTKPGTRGLHLRRFYGVAGGDHCLDAGDPRGVDDGDAQPPLQQRPHPLPRRAHHRQVLPRPQRTTITVSTARHRRPLRGRKVRVDQNTQIEAIFQRLRGGLFNGADPVHGERDPPFAEF